MNNRNPFFTGILLAVTVVSSFAQPKEPNQDRTVEHLYPNLVSGALTYGVVRELPEGILLKAGNLVISSKELTEEIETSEESIRPQLAKNGVFLLEQIATFKLLLLEAQMQEAPNNPPEKEPGTVIQKYLQKLTETIKVSDAEVLDFYNHNKEMIGGAALPLVKAQIEQFLLQQKQQDFLADHIQTIGQRIPIEISDSWLKVQAPLTLDNPLDKARASGKPTLAELGASGCIPCDMMQPILEALRTKYAEKLNILFVHVGQERILGARYGVQSIPVQIFFDKNGKEFFRHTGFFAQEEIEKKLAEMEVH